VTIGPTEQGLRCRHQGLCGGCSHLGESPEAQLARKSMALRALLSGLLSPEMEIGVEAPVRSPIHARTKLSWPVRREGPDGLATGMFARGSHELVPIEECWLGDPALTLIQARAAELLRRSRVDGYDERAGRGLVRAFHARFVAGSGEMLLGLTTTCAAWPQEERVAHELIEAASSLRDSEGRPLRPVGFVRSLLDGPSNALLGHQQRTLVGRDHLFDEVAGLRIRVSFASFYQSHRDADALLFQPALRMLGPVRPTDRIVDGYGGVGTFGLRLARAGARRVELVESSPTATRDAVENAAANSLPNLHVIDAPFGEACLEGGADAVVVDPPRKGLGADGVAQLLHLGAPRVLYVACGPKALARDLVPLLAAGYRIADVRIADLFPHTEHYETLCLLRRGEVPDA
jgi:23S rRNA (uracil1939-C5)-methyltransferase